MMPYKRAAGDKSGVPVYQPSATAYQQLLQPFVPVSCEYRAPAPAPTPAAYTGVPLNKPTPAAAAANYQLLTQHFAALAAMRPPVPPPAYPSTSTAPPTPHTHTHTHTNPTIINDLLAAAVNNNNNDDELQPYKKMKTTWTVMKVLYASLSVYIVFL